jgi:hypothetical protein
MFCKLKLGNTISLRDCHHFDVRHWRTTFMATEIDTLTLEETAGLYDRIAEGKKAWDVLPCNIDLEETVDLLEQIGSGKKVWDDLPCDGELEETVSLLKHIESCKQVWDDLPCNDDLKEMVSLLDRLPSNSELDEIIEKLERIALLGSHAHAGHNGSDGSARILWRGIGGLWL